jgi:outer membrane protein assembly factor BamE
MLAMAGFRWCSGQKTCRYNRRDHIATGLPMPAFSSRAARLALATAAIGAGVVATGCGSFDSATQRFASSITPYKIEVVQGNFVSREQVEALKPGMGRGQVRDILGTPLVTSVFHADRWDYIFTLKRQGVPSQERRLTVYFKGDVFDRVEGDTMPTEAEFVSTLDNKRRGAKVPVLEASEESLKRFNPGRNASAAPAPAPEPPTAASYPPLETPAR